MNAAPLNALATGIYVPGPSDSLTMLALVIMGIAGGIFLALLEHR